MPRHLGNSAYSLVQFRYLLAWVTFYNFFFTFYILSRVLRSWRFIVIIWTFYIYAYKHIIYSFSFTTMAEKNNETKNKHIEGNTY